jgi:hypothetical protein
MNDFAHITWGRNAQGRLIPLGVTYDRATVEQVTIIRRDIQAATPAAEIKRVSLPVISLPMVENETVVPFRQPRPPVVPRPRQASALARIERIRLIHRKMKRQGRLADRGLLEEIAL